MAIDSSSQLLQLLTQLQGGGVDAPITPVSGIGQGTPLSGLPLGEQGMGLGGGGSLLGGSAGGLGGGSAGLGGLDLFQLLAQLQEGGGFAGPTSLGQPTGAGGLGQPGFGAGGALTPQTGFAAAPQQAGLGGGREALLALNLLKESLGIGRNLSGLGGPPPSSTASPSMTASLGGGGEFPESFGAVAGARFPPEFPLEATGTAAPGGGIFSQAGNILPALPGAGFSATQPAAVSAPFLAGGGPESVGNLEGLAGTGGVDTLGNLGSLAGQAGPPIAIAAFLANIGQQLARGDIKGGLLNLFTGNLGGLFGGLFGGGHTKGSSVTLPGFTEPVQTQTAGGTQTLLKSFQEGQGALGPFTNALQAAQTPDALLSVLNQQFSPITGQFQVRSGAGGGFGNLPGFNPNFAHPFTLAALQNPEVLQGLQVFAGALGAPAEQPGVADFVRQRIGQLLPPLPPPSSTQPTTAPTLGGSPPAPPPTGGPGQLAQFPGAPQFGGSETDPATLLALLKQMGLV